MSTMQRVREAISQSHDAIEQTDFAKSLLDGRITRPAYGVYLNQLWHIHHALEKSMAECPLVASFLTPAMMRTSTLVKDAAVMGQAIDASSRLPRTRDIESTIFKWVRRITVCTSGMPLHSRRIADGIADDRQTAGEIAAPN